MDIITAYAACCTPVAEPTPVNLTAQAIATLITANCDAHLSGAKSRAEWDREQRRLWKLAERRKIGFDVLQLVLPTLAVGR